MKEKNIELIKNMFFDLGWDVFFLLV